MDTEFAWLLDWFKGRRPDIIPASERLGSFNYFDAGWIDSMGIIELIGDIEAHFAMRFEHDDFQDRRFSTLGGLAALIAEKRVAARGAQQ